MTNTPAVVTPVVARLAVRLGVVDRPGPLKVQSRPVPYLGGVAMLAGIVAAYLVARELPFLSTAASSVFAYRVAGSGSAASLLSSSSDWLVIAGR